MNKNTLRLVFWETTKDCNLNCMHCRMDPIDKSVNITQEQAYYFVDSIAEFANPILILSGGEPLTRTDIFDIASYASSKNLPVALASNGTLINNETASKIKSSGIRRVSISFDGIDSNSHDTFRNVEGAFDLALNGLNILISNNISTQINTTITKLNVDYLEEFVNFAIDQNVDAIHFFLVVPVGCGLELGQNVILSPKEYENTLDAIYQIEHEYKEKMFIKVTCAPQYYRNLSQKIDHDISNPTSFHKTTKGCLAGTNVCFVNHKGDVYPCGYLPVKAGNIFTTPLKNIWKDSEVFNNLRDFEKYEANCSTCDANNVCGGCRARAYADTLGNYLAKDNNCKLNW